MDNKIVCFQCNGNGPKVEYAAVWAYRSHEDEEKELVDVVENWAYCCEVSRVDPGLTGKKPMLTQLDETPDEVPF